MTKMYRTIILLVMYLLCSCQSQDERRLAYALKEAGGNKGELEKVLIHFAGDSLKLEAAKFLIYNMPYHSGFYDTLFTSDGKVYMPDISYPQYNDEQVLQMFDSLLQCGCQVRSVKKRDIELVSAEFLIDNIDCAFEVWKKPWAKSISFEDFCRYILPYRSSNEPLCSLRGEIQKRYCFFLDSLNVEDPLGACTALNTKLKESFKFVGTIPLNSSIESVEKYKRSNCEGLAMYFTFLMRAVGIPVTLDCTTWAKSEDGHYWCVVMDQNRTFHGFAPAELNCNEFEKTFSGKRTLIFPKVYRRLFAPEPAEMEVEDDGYRTYVKNPLFKDVTSTYYVPPIDVVVDLPEESKGDESFVYLCASSVNHYRVLAVGVRKGRQCRVKNVVGDNTFVLADCPDGVNLRFLTKPFYVDSLGRSK